MKKLRHRLFAIMMMLVLCLGTMQVSAAEEPTPQTAKHYNVVLVIDGSGSLTMRNGTDLQGYRYQAIELFLGVLTNEGNKVGAIVFNDQPTMPLDTGLKDLPSMAEKKDLAARIRETGARSDTDIGSALLRALEELNGPDADPSIPSCIVLFSDGETDLGNTADTQASLAKKDQAIEQAKSLGIPIHGICLNTNDSANTQEVKGIADGTSGFYQEIKNAEDLEDTFLQFYSMIYGTTIIGEPEQESPIEKKFKIPSEGVAEVNILMESTNSDKVVTLIRPDGIAFSDVELEATSMAAGNHEIIKIVRPEEGVWTLKVDGAPGTKVKIDWIYNTDLSAEIECDDSAVKLNADIPIKGYLLSKNQRVENSQVYGEYSGTLLVTNTVTGAVKSYPMQADGAAFTVNIKFAETGTYEAAIQLDCGDITHVSEPKLLNVGNEPPIVFPSVEKGKITVVFGGSGKKSFALDEYFRDPEGGKLTYKVAETTYKEADAASLESGQLTIETGEKKGSVTVAATDEQGASAEMVFEITVSDITWIFIVIPVITVLVVVMLLISKKNKEGNVTYNATVTVSSFDQNSGAHSQPFPHTGVKGKKNLREWQTIDCGIQGDFEARQIKGKKSSELYFVSKQPFETEDGRVVKEYKFVMGDEVCLFAASNSEADRMTRGIRVLISDSMDW